MTNEILKAEAVETEDAKASEDTKRFIRKTDTRALGIINKNTSEEIVEKGLADDERLLTEVFKIFNNEFYDGKILEPVIHISPSVKENIGIKITEHEEWVKSDNGKSEICKGLYISDKILKYGMVSEAGMENAYIMLVVGMITLYDNEMREAYKTEFDIRSEEEKAQESKKGTKSSKRKKKYKGMVTRGGYYYTEEFATECERIGIEAKAIKDETGKPTGKYNLSAGELFIEILEKYDLLSRRFVCAKYQHYYQDKNKVLTDGKKKSSVRTYQCPICKLNVRGTKSGIRIKCVSEEHAGKEPIMIEV